MGEAPWLSPRWSRWRRALSALLPGLSSEPASARWCGEAVSQLCGDASLHFLFVVGADSGDVTVGRRSLIGDADAVGSLLVLHSEVEVFSLEQVGDLVQRLLAEVLDLENLALALADQIAQGADVGILERVHGANRELEVFDRSAQHFGETVRVPARHVRARGKRSRSVGAEAGEILEVRLRQGGGVAHCLFRGDCAIR